MATPLQKVVDVIDAHKGFTTEYQGDMVWKYARTGLTQASIVLEKEYSVSYGSYSQEVDNGIVQIVDGLIIDQDMTAKEIYLAGLYATRNFLLSEHEDLTRKAVNFKTINFAVHGLTERAKEYMRMVWWINGEIKTVIDQISDAKGSSSAMGSV